MILFNARALFFLIFATVALSACSIYESDGRKAIEKNQGNIVGSGVSPLLGLFYICEQTTNAPTFTKDPLEVVESEYEEAHISTLLNQQSEPHWIVAYHHNEETLVHTFCKVYPGKNKSFNNIKKAAALAGQELINHL
jgi:hypothetical protein